MTTEAPLEEQYPFLTVMHPAHLVYVRHLPLNTLDVFLGSLDSLELGKRSRAIVGVYPFVFRATYEQLEVRYGATLGETTYEAFKDQCRDLTSEIDESLMVLALVHFTLSNLLGGGDTTSIGAVKDSLIPLAETDLAATGVRGDEVRWLVDHIESIPEQMAEGHELYVYFCERVVQQLLLESPA